jgi:hypothetical protein
MALANAFHGRLLSNFVNHPNSDQWQVLSSRDSYSIFIDILACVFIVAANGYETIDILSSDYNFTQSLWW